jgi:Hyphally regulated cell wall protein N-terminal
LDAHGYCERRSNCRTTNQYLASAEHDRIRIQLASGITATSVKIWNGATADIRTAADWSPTGSPGAGDIGVISSGAVLANGLFLDGFLLRLIGNALGVAPTLEMTGTKLGHDFSVRAQFGNSTRRPTTAINVNGIVTNDGKIFAGTVNVAASLQIQLGSRTAELVNTGLIQADPGSSIAITAGQVVNGGHIVADGGTLDLNTQMTGTGSIVIERDAAGHGGVVHAEQIVGSGQTVMVHGGVLQLGSANNFLGTLQGWGSGSTLQLLHMHLTSEDVTHGVLTLHDGLFTEAAIKIGAGYSSGDFHITNQADGTALITTVHTGLWS